MIRCKKCGFINNESAVTCSKCHTFLSGYRTGFKHTRMPVVYDVTQEKPSPPEFLQLSERDQIITHAHNYSVIKKIGTGGFGSVYQVVDQKGIYYALKILSLWEIEPEDHKEIVHRFHREYQAAQIECPYIVNSREKGSIRGNPFYVMDFLSGGDLRDKLFTSLGEPEIKRLALNILLGLKALHQSGVIHRDLKPENVLFDQYGRAILTDFGISGFLHNRHTVVNKKGQVKRVWGTILYMPPEQLNLNQAFHSVGPVTDIFAFGVLMYETWTKGEMPFGSLKDYQKERKAYYQKITRGEWIPIRQVAPHVPSHWEKLIKQCLASDRKNRFQDVDSILSILGATHTTGEVSLLSEDKDPRKLILTIMNGEEIGKQHHLFDLCQRKNRFMLKVGWLDPQNLGINDIEIKETFTKYISRHHATLELVDSKWYIRDGQWMKKENKMGWYPSTNGVFVDSQVVSTTGVPIIPGHIITFGDTTLKVEL